MNTGKLIVNKDNKPVNHGYDQDQPAPVPVNPTPAPVDPTPAPVDPTPKPDVKPVDPQVKPTVPESIIAENPPVADKDAPAVVLRKNNK